jgi:hypothetical protein
MRSHPIANSCFDVCDCGFETRSQVSIMVARRRTDVELKLISNEHQGACAARVFGETDRRSLCQECAAGRAIAVTRNPQPGFAAADRK